MRISDILTPEHTINNAMGESKKRVLELISQLATKNLNGVNSKAVLETLVNRERLGSTAIGHGIAIPHGRIAGIKAPIGTLVRLQKGIYFDAQDEQPVDILFGLLVPLEATEEHLQALAVLASLFDHEEFRRSLRHAKTNEEFYQLMVGSDYS